ncbi:hypothetical protein K466DRAFT_374070 [Polyporus arcularius HHB13444]|uniref:Homeobox domain-containing protein n=1 Tax=Polyporus arcularius HHB13444 TaxID=1314778 RepID=A0A5C3PMP1_9APHY|nr:hypothetical protein K466DRAFT_374070 [Polyporus arcularius HHB13444]
MYTTTYDIPQDDFGHAERHGVPAQDQPSTSNNPGGGFAHDVAPAPHSPPAPHAPHEPDNQEAYALPGSDYCTMDPPVCSNCSRMPLRCDSTSPECLNCTQRQVDCIYPAAPAGQTVPTDSAMSTPRSSRMSLGEAKCYLEKYYTSDRAGSKDPTPEQRKSLSETTGLSDDAVRLWFVERRRKDPSYATGSTPPDPRRHISDAQKAQLQGLLDEGELSSKEERDRIAEELGLEAETVHIWFVPSSRSHLYCA